MLPHFLKHCSIQSRPQYMNMHTCVSPLPVTSTFCLDGHSLSFFKSEYLTWLSHCWSFSVSPGTLHHSVNLSVIFFSSFFMILLNLFFCSISGLWLRMCWFSFVGLLYLIFLSLLTFLSHPLNPMPCFQCLLCCVAFISMMLVYF